LILGGCPAILAPSFLGITLPRVDDEACIRERRDGQELMGKGRACTFPTITSVGGGFYIARFLANL
jgi:hypothetical protein